jgi:hypothetical protein
MTVLSRCLVSALDSAAWRGLSRSTAGRRVLRSPAMANVDNARRFAWSALQCARRPHAFAATRTVLVVIGHVKSGGSLLGAVLDAHPDAVVADEADLVRYVEAGFSRDQILHLMAKGARREAAKGRVTARRLEPYSLAVPGQWQGRCRVPLVVGDSRAGPTTRRIGADPTCLDRLVRTMAGSEVRFLHVVRNPLDPVSAMVLRSGRALDDAIADHLAQCRRLEALRRRIPAEHLLTVRYEDLVRDPVEVIGRACDHLGLARDGAHLAAAARLVRRDRRPERQQLTWDADRAARLLDAAARYDFLQGYGQQPA